MLKSAFFGFIKFILFVISCIIFAVFWPFIIIFSPKKQRNRNYALLMHYCLRFAFVAKIKYINFENFDQEKNFVFVCNHQSLYDVIVIGPIFPQNAYTLAKHSLQFVPIFGQLYSLTGNFYIKRGHSESARKTMDGVVKRIKEIKCSLFIFPQGTRSKDNKITKLKKGFIHLAKSTQTDICVYVLSTYKLADLVLNFKNKRSIYAKNCGVVSHTHTEEEILEKVKTMMTQNLAELDSLPD